MNEKTSMVQRSFLSNEELNVKTEKKKKKKKKC